MEITKDASGRYVALKLLGTDLESLLTWGTGTTHYARVHLCNADCSQEAVGPGLIHCKRYRAIGSLEDLDGLPWQDVPRDGDELAGLRGRMGSLPDLPGGDGRATGSKDGKDDSKVKDKKKQKKKKHRRRRRRSSSPDDKKKRSRSSRSRKRGRRARRRKRQLWTGQGALGRAVHRRARVHPQGTPRSIRSGCSATADSTQ